MARKKRRKKRAGSRRRRRDPRTLKLRRPWASSPDEPETPERMARSSPHAAEVYAGMPRSEWKTGYDMIRTFLLDRPPKHPELVRAVLCESLASVQSWGDFLGGGWVLGAGVVFDQHVHVPGFRAGRLYQTLERLVRWLHARGDLDDWQRARLGHAIDEARYCHGLRPELPGPRGLERPVRRWERERVSERFAATLSHPVEREVAPGAVRVLSAYLEAQLGRGEALPFGALDVDLFVQLNLESSSEGSAEATCALFGIAAAFYRWLADEERLDPERAARQASKLAAASLGMSVALSA